MRIINMSTGRKWLHLYGGLQMGSFFQIYVNRMVTHTSHLSPGKCSDSFQLSENELLSRQKIVESWATETNVKKGKWNKFAVIQERTELFPSTCSSRRRQKQKQKKYNGNGIGYMSIEQRGVWKKKRKIWLVKSGKEFSVGGGGGGGLFNLVSLSNPVMYCLFFPSWRHIV